MTEDQLIETWQIHSRISQYILKAIAPAIFELPVPKKGRSAVQMLAHIHNVRLLWLQSALPEAPASVVKLATDTQLTRDQLHMALQASTAAIGDLLCLGLRTGRIKGFKPHPTAFLGYLIAHESYHHGEIGIALASAGYPLDRKTAFGIWEWGIR